MSRSDFDLEKHRLKERGIRSKTGKSGLPLHGIHWDFPWSWHFLRGTPLARSTIVIISLPIHPSHLISHHPNSFFRLCQGMSQRNDVSITQGITQHSAQLIKRWQASSRRIWLPCLSTGWRDWNRCLRTMVIIIHKLPVGPFTFLQCLSGTELLNLSGTPYILFQSTQAEKNNCIYPLLMPWKSFGPSPRICISELPSPLSFCHLQNSHRFIWATSKFVRMTYQTRGLVTIYGSHEGDRGA
jgi:hypothetical protein